VDWLTRLFSATDRTAEHIEAAGERIAAAAEDMAGTWELADKRTCHRLEGAERLSRR